MEFSFPKCQKCEMGDLVPLSDFGSQGAPIHYKAWACTNPTCGFNLKIRNGDLYIDEPIVSGAMHTPRVRAYTPLPLGTGPRAEPNADRCATTSVPDFLTWPR